MSTTQGPWSVFSVYAQHEVRTPTGTLIAVVCSRDDACLIAGTPGLLDALIQCRAVLRTTLHETPEGDEPKRSVLARRISAATAAIDAATRRTS